MKIKRMINGEEVEIELTSDEIGEAHKVFITSWMREEILNSADTKKVLTEKEAEIVAEMAYDKYNKCEGLTEYEALEQALEEYEKRADLH